MPATRGEGEARRSGSEAWRLVVGTLVLAVLALFIALRFQVTTDITHFLPGGEADRDVLLARQLAAGELSRTMVLLLDGGEDGDAERLVQASRELEAALRAEPGVAAGLSFLEAGPPAGIEEAIWTLYQPRRFSFLEFEPENVRSRLIDAELTAAAGRLKRRLALPISSLVSRVAPADPLLILPGLFERLAGSRAEQLQVVDGRFLTADGRGAVLFVGTREASFDSSAQRPFLAGVQAAFARVNAGFGGGLGLAQSGANRFAVRAEQAIKADIRRVTIGSIVGLTLLFLLLFRSLRLVLLTVPVLGAGFLAGTASCLLLFGRLHGLTLAFGAALIGVSIDYAIHFHCHQTLAPDPAGPRRTLGGIWIGLLLGALTTIVGFVALVVSSFPGLREMAVFAAFGIGAALIATRVFLPGLVRASAPPTRASRALARWIGVGVTAMAKRRVVLALPLIGVVLLAGYGLLRAGWNDDIADLNQLDPELVREDESVRQRVVRYEQRRLVIAVGADEQAALEVNDRVHLALAAAREAGELGGFRNLASLLPSAARQQAVAAALRDDPTVWPRLRDALADEGFVAGSFEPFREALAATPVEPLLPADLRDSPLLPLVRPHQVTLEQGVGVLSFLHELHDPQAVARRLAELEGARLVDLGGTLTRAYGAYREKMTTLLLLGVLAVILVVWIRYRAIRPTLAACLPALLALFGTVGVLALAGVELNVLSLVALLMIFSMGVDYGVFLAETGDDDALGATRLAVVVAGLSTLFGFGLLAFSDHPALFNMGLTSGVGVLLSMFLAPTVHALCRRPAEET